MSKKNFSDSRKQAYIKMPSSSFRIGSRSSTNTTEGEILRSLFQLRKRLTDPSSEKITEITFWNCHWTQQIIHSLRKLIVRDGNYFTSIKFFDCRINNPSFMEIISMILKCNSTSKLTIKRRRMVESRMENNEQTLSLCRFRTAADNKILATIRDGISNNKSLHYLKLSGLDFGDATLLATDEDWIGLKDNNTLLQLDLSDSNFSKSKIKNLAATLSFNATLQSLNLSRCGLDDDFLSQILQSVVEHSSLVQLDLSKNFLANNYCTEAINVVTKLFRCNRKLECLNLSTQQPSRDNVVIEENEMNQERLKIAFQNAFNALSKNTTLRKIDLSGNSSCFFDLDNVKVLSSCLVTNKGLLHVDISSCYFSCLGLSYLAKHCIPFCGVNLKSLILFDDKIDDRHITQNENWDEAFLLLERGLQSNFTLENLGDLHNASISFNLRISLQHLLNMNRAGRRAFQIHNFPPAAWTNVLSRASTIEYDICRSGRNNAEGVEASLSNTASVLFTFLQSPFVVEGR